MFVLCVCFGVCFVSSFGRQLAFCISPVLFQLEIDRPPDILIAKINCAPTAPGQLSCLIAVFFKPLTSFEPIGRKGADCVGGVDSFLWRLIIFFSAEG